MYQYPHPHPSGPLGGERKLVKGTKIGVIDRLNKEVEMVAGAAHKL